MRSCRRIFLDQFLFNYENKLEGNILDIGGEKNSKKGLYKPYTNKKIKSWKFLNVSKEKEPDFLISAEKISELKLIFDGFLLCEVLEHLENPEKVINAISDSLIPGAKGLITIPFLVGEHSDPYDFQRFLPNKLEILLNKENFEIIEFRYMGGLTAAIFDLLLLDSNYSLNKLKSKVIIKILKIMQNLIINFSIGLTSKKQKFTTGYALLVRKKI